MSYYVVNVSGYETYEPIWFESDCSKIQFKKVVRECSEVALNKLMRKRRKDQIGGHDVLEVLVPLLEEKGFKKIVPDLEISLNGECYYSKGCYEKPAIFSRKMWKQVVEFNQKINDEDMKKWQKEQKKKKIKEGKIR